MAVAKTFGARTAVINHSVEITDPRLQAIVAHVYRKTDFISVREQPSAERVVALNVPANRVHIAPDLVFLALHLAPARLERSRAERTCRAPHPRRRHWLLHQRPRSRQWQR